MLEVFNTYRVDVQQIASVVLALAIWRLGAAPERWMMAIFVVTMVLPVRLFGWLGLGNLALGQFAWVYVSASLRSRSMPIAIIRCGWPVSS
jgi:hypothetical protein